jgi:hypothetical protein
MTTENKIKAFVAIISLAAFFFSVFQFLNIQSIEAKKPYLTKKLAWCEEAVNTSARIANASVRSDTDIARFWEMYWGVMGMIERENVTLAMVAFGDALNAGEEAGATSKIDGPISGLTSRSLDLAHACRKELSLEWSPSWAR